MDNSGKAIGSLNRSKLSSSEAEHDFGEHVLRGSVGRTEGRDERREDYLGLPKVGNACARGAVCVRALGGGSVTPNPALSARGRDRALKIKGTLLRGLRSLPAVRCLGSRHWRNPAGLSYAYARENSFTFNWTRTCVTSDRGVTEDSTHDGSNRRVHGHRSTRHGKRKRTVSIDRRRTGRCGRGAGLHGCGPRRS